tara:strand:+ start:71 stop:694 length:624 start_codon:yes stop_codon:yes gene_type:complete
MLLSDIKPPLNSAMQVFLPNEGYLVGELPQDLYNNLLNEGLDCEQRNKTRLTGLVTVDGDQTCPHYDVSEKNSKLLENFLGYYIDLYEQSFDYLSHFKILDRDIPLSFQTPWYNIQRPNDYLTGHSHNGVFSYTIWLKLPSKSVFTFIYSHVGGRTASESLELKPEDNGKFIIFPSSLYHEVPPYRSKNENEKRIAISGNIQFKSNE